MAITAVAGFTEPFKNTHPFYRFGYVNAKRTATGSGVGSAVVVGARAVIVTATGSGLGASSATGLHTAPRTATGSGTGTSTTVQLISHVRTATGSGTGTSTVVQIRVVVRVGSDSVGTGSSTVSQVLKRIVTASGSGTGSATTISLHVVIRTGTGAGDGTSTTTSVLTAIRTASGSGTGTSTTVGARALFRTGTGSGLGTETADWTKSHIFRVPTTSTYPFAKRFGESPADRLFAFMPQGIRQYNLFKLDDNSYQITDPRMPERIVKVYYGGHDNFLDDTEVAELTAAGYGASIT